MAIASAGTQGKCCTHELANNVVFYDSFNLSSLFYCSEMFLLFCKRKCYGLAKNKKKKMREEGGQGQREPDPSDHFKQWLP